MYALDPNGLCRHSTASADDPSLHPIDGVGMQGQLGYCERWAWDFHAHWAPEKSLVLVPPGLAVIVHLSGRQITVAASSRLLGMKILAGRHADVVSRIAITRIDKAKGLAARWTKEVPDLGSRPRFGLRRSLFTQNSQPVAEFGFLVTSHSEKLVWKMKSFDRAARRWKYVGTIPAG